MIYIFRREMKKWHIVLWIVFASMALSGVSLLFWRNPRIDDIKVATVNGEIIPFKRYKQVLADTQQRISSLKEYARMLGVSEAMFLKNYYESINPHDVALETTIREALIDQIKNPFKINLASEYFKEELIRSIPHELIDEEGRINLDSYQGYLSRLATTPAEFEKSKEEEFKRQLVERFVMHSDYLPNYFARDVFEQKEAKKSFTIVYFPFERFLEEAKKKELSKEELKNYYEENKEQYRIPEKHKAFYWQVDPESYAKDSELDDATIQAFYDKNRTTFRIPPQIKVRHILFKSPTIAQKVYEEAKKQPENFARLAEEHSQDEATAKNGGLTDFFRSGTFDPDFEKAAFRLQKKGDISAIVKTQQGYEIIQLDERIKAGEKKLDEVKEEIIKTIKAKRALSKLKSDLEIMLHQVRSGEKTVIAFAQENKFEQKESDWITPDMSDKKDTIGLIAEFLFGTRKRQNRYGYFFNEGKYTIYQISETQKSFIQSFEDVNDKVRDSLIQKKAQSSLKTLVSETRSLILNKKTTLTEFAVQNNFKIIQVENIKKGEKIENLSESGDLSNRIFVLSDSLQLLHHRHEGESYLVQLKGLELLDTKQFEVERLKIIRNEKFRNSNIHISAFIASLQKNAKIDVDKNVLKTYKGSL